MTDAEHLARAREFQSKGSMQEAIIEGKSAVQKNPQNGEARWLLGEIYAELNRGPEAEKELLKAEELGIGMESLKVALGKAYLAQGKHERVLAEIDVGPNSSAISAAKILEVRGYAQLMNGRVDDACALFAQSRKGQPTYVPAFLGEARCALAKNDRDGAKSHIEQALAVDPLHAEALTLLGDVERTGKRYKEAEAAYDRALSVRDGNGMALLGRATARIEQNNWSGAEEDISKVLKASPQNYEGHYLKGRSLQRQRKLTEAQSAYTEALRINPEHMPSVLGLGLVQLAAGDFEQALVHLSRFSLAFPNQAEVKAILAYAQVKAGNPKAAAAELKKIDLAQINDPEKLLIIGQAHLVAGQTEASKQFFAAAIDRKPDSTEARLQMAGALAATGENSLAIDQIEKALEIDPNVGGAEELLVQNFVKAKKYEEALSAADKLGRQKGKEGLAQNYRGWIFTLQGNVVGAKQAFEKALALDPGNPPAAHNLAALALKDKNFDQARSYYEQVLAKAPNYLPTLLALYRIEQQANRSAEAQQVLNRASAAYPKDPSVAALQALQYLTARDPRKLLDVTAEAARAYPKSPALLELRGLAYLMEGDQQNAIVAFTSLVQVKPDAPEAHFHLATAYLKAKDAKNARTALEETLRLSPQHLKAKSALARLLNAEGQTDRALVLSKELKKEHPKVPNGSLIEAEALVGKKRYADAVKVLREGKSSWPQSPDLVLSLSQALALAGDNEAGIQEIVQWRKARPNDAWAVGYLADAYYTAGRKSEAIGAYQDLLKLIPNSVKALNNLAGLVEDQDQAQRYAEAAHKLAPENADVLDTLGWLMVQRGETSRGLDLVSKAKRLAPGNLTIRYHYAAALAKNGAKDAARKELEALLATKRPFPEVSDARALLSQL